MTRLDELKDATEKSTKALEWLAELLRSKNSVSQFALAFVAIAILCNQGIVSESVKVVSLNIRFPPWYPRVYYLVLAALFVAALVAAIRQKKATTSAAVDLTKRSPIKVLRPWTYDDAELFAQMQRENDLRTCIEAVTAPDFRFGILIGESGCGKSSFLQAGLWPRLEQQKTAYPCLYVKLTEEDPVEALRRVIEERFKLPQEGKILSDFVTLLGRVVQAKGPNVVVLFDQFEQFFVKRKSIEERAAFVRALAQWYTRKPPLPVRILVCFRADLFHFSLELQKAMSYALGPQESLELKKLDPGQATEIFRVMAEVEGIGFDTAFVKEMVRDELASREDGLISPVDLQILAWMMTGQGAGEKIGFRRASYQRLGGVEGLLERFLDRALRARETEARRQAAIKVMLALTDFERDARAGLLSIEDIRQKLGSTLTDKDLEEAVTWLARNGLITPQERAGQQGYELAHERLIPALQKLAGRNLNAADWANQLLDRRVHEWLGNDRASRYLLTWREWRRIRQQTPYLVWGVNQRQKKALLEQSKSHWLRRASALAAFALIVGGVGGWWLTPDGQMWQLKRDLSALSERTRTFDVLVAITDAYQSAGDHRQANTLLEKARKSTETISNPETKASALVALAKVAAKLDDRKQATRLLEIALRQSNETIGSPESRPTALGALAEAAAKLGDREWAARLLETARQSAETISNPENKATALGTLADVAGKLSDGKEAAELLEIARQSAETIDDPKSKATVFGALAEVAAKRNDGKQAARLLEIARQSAEAIDDSWSKAWALVALAKVAAKLDDRKQAARLFEIARQSAQTIPGSWDKATFFGALAEVAARRNDGKQAAELLEIARQSAETIDDSWIKADALVVLASVAVKLNDRKQAAELLEIARQSAEAIGDSSSKANMLLRLARVSIERRDFSAARRTAALIGVDDLRAKAWAEILHAWYARNHHDLAEGAVASTQR